jgi:hypothetical protein
MCVHPYKCECLEYLKSTMCKHVHMVRMYERESGTNTVLEDVANSITKDRSEINQHHQEDMTDKKTHPRMTRCKQIRK